MRNRFLSLTAKPPVDLPSVEQSPELRMRALLALFVLPILAVALRLVWLQAAQVEQYREPFERITVQLEPILTRDGRILSADGQILADHDQQFDLQVHYRWLESPPDPGWLKKQAYSRLDRSERRNELLVRQATEAVLEQRERMWRQLASLAGESPGSLQEKRHRIQQRIERIRADVEERRAEKKRELAQTESTLEETFRSWETVWRQFRHALTTEPQRSDPGPLVIKEELDYHPLVPDVPLAVAAEVQAHPEVYAGLQVIPVIRRIYPRRELAAHVVGYRQPATAEVWSEDQLTQIAPVQSVGQTGIEKAWDRYLRGTQGLRRVQRNRRGEIIQTDTLRQPRLGTDLVLTLDVPLQQLAEQLLDQALANASARRETPTPQGGCIVVMDVKTGAVLAAASAPRFDLNLLIAPEPARWQEIQDDPRRPLFPRLTGMALPPGAIFKPVSAVAFLESGLIDPDQRIHCQGFLEVPSRQRCAIYRHFGVGHGPLNLADALSQSCNVYFYQGARQTGASPLALWGRRFGLGVPTGVDLPAESPGLLPDPDQQSVGEPWYPGDTLGFAIGQHRLTATPLQVTVMLAAIANGGWRVRPYLVENTASPSLSGDDLPQPLPRRIPPQKIPYLSAETLQAIRAGLERAVQHPQGTGHKTVMLEAVAMAGKTGTAEVAGSRPDHAWYAGYVPASAPRYAITVVLEHGGDGSAAAGPLARELVRGLLARGLLTTPE